MNNVTAISVKKDETYMSFKLETMEDKKSLFNAINKPEYRLSDFINKEIRMKDVILLGIEIEDRHTGFSDEKIMRPCIRTIIIDENGKTYAATSDGIASSIRALSTVFGTLHFEDPLAITVRQVPTKNGTILTIELL